MRKFTIALDIKAIEIKGTAVRVKAESRDRSVSVHFTRRQKEDDGGGAVNDAAALLYYAGVGEELSITVEEGPRVAAREPVGETERRDWPWR